MHKRGVAAPALVACLMFPVLLAACGGSTSPPRTASIVKLTAAMRPTSAEARHCATTEAATWMGCLASAHPAFDGAPLSGLALPGSDDAGAYSLDPEAYDTSKGSACASTLAQHSAASDGPTVQAWSETQDESITQQLDAGVRWIDLQVGFNGTDAVNGWRITNNLYSDYPLSYYLDQVAAWASTHHSEAVVVDLRTICYDHYETKADYAGLWANFAQASAPEAITTTMSKVAYNPTAHAGLTPASATLGQVTTQGGGGHNVMIVVPPTARDLGALTATEHIHAVRAEPGNVVEVGSDSAMAVAFPMPTVAPSTASGQGAANQALAKVPEHASPAFGSLVGQGFSVAELTYDPGALSAKAQTSTLFGAFGGLVVSASTGSTPADTAWEHGLVSATPSRNDVVATWGHRANVVLTDGVEMGGFTAAVIEANAG